MTDISTIQNKLLALTDNERQVYYTESYRPEFYDSYFVSIMDTTNGGYEYNAHTREEVWDAVDTKYIGEYGIKRYWYCVAEDGTLGRSLLMITERQAKDLLGKVIWHDPYGYLGDGVY